MEDLSLSAVLPVDGPHQGAKERPLHICLDVDGVMTTGEFYDRADSQVMKVFDPDDHDALLLRQPHIGIRCVTGDRKGFPTSRRGIIDDMKMSFDLVSTYTACFDARRGR